MAAKSSQNYWGYRLGSRVTDLLKNPAKTGKSAEVQVRLDKKTPKEWQAFFPDSKAVVRVSETAERVRILVNPLALEEIEKDPRLKAAALTRIRDAMGGLWSTLERLEVKQAEIRFELNELQLSAALTGLEISLYRFKRAFKGEASDISLKLFNRGRAVAVDSVDKATRLGQSVNLARHLINLPPNLLNPETYSDFVSSVFKGKPGVKVEVWDHVRLKKEKMNLHLAVGMGSNAAPALVHIQWRPKGAKGLPVALVGKGITFDTGGLDIKPSSGMRLMKKDMGGSAAVLGTALWAVLSGLKLNLDVYLALAENAISDESFRPSDVVVARNGLSVEIHNTDAEGRLVLADALDVAVKQKVKPRFVVDVATLTGAIKVALGSQLAGLFANDNKLSSALFSAGSEAGDLMWPMPLYRKYNPQMASNFADVVNATDGFGGAVTAALFLEKFVGDVPWAHLDIYAWKDAPDGCWLEAGGSGQSVMALATWLENI